MAPQKIFLSYSRQNESLKNEILESFKNAIRPHVIWTDQNIQPGDDWEAKIDAALSDTTMAILLLSREFLASDFIRRKELPYLLQRAKDKKIKLTWIRLTPCFYEEFEINRYQGLHAESDHALIDIPQDRRYGVIYDMTLALRELLREVSETSTTSEAEEEEAEATKVPKPICHIVCGAYGAPDRNAHARERCEDLLGVACRQAEFDPVIVSSNEQDILDPAISPLLHTPMIVVYLGRLQWQSDILAMLGFCMASGRPLVVVGERNGWDAELSDGVREAIRVRGGVDISISTNTEASIGRISHAIEEQKGRLSGSPWKQPVTLVEIDLAADSDDQERYLAATPAADRELLGEDEGSVVGRRGTDIVASLESRIVREQWRWFGAEQEELYSSFLAPATHQSSQTPTARIPMVFEASGSRRAILPIVTRHATKRGKHHLEVVHLNVTNQLNRAADGHFEITPPLGVDGLSIWHRARNISHYAAMPCLEFDRSFSLCSGNVAFRALCGDRFSDVLGRSWQDLGVSDVTGPCTPPESWRNPSEFGYDDASALEQVFDFAETPFGRGKIRGTMTPLIDLCSGNPNGFTWSWRIESLEMLDEYRKTVTTELEHELLWQIYASSYDRVLPELDYYKEVVERHRREMTKDGVHHIADIGAGTGNVTVPVLEAGRSVVAVDLSRVMLDRLQSKLFGRFGDKLRVIDQSAERLSPFLNNTFDGVSAMMSLYDMDDDRAALAECVRLLKPGGTLVITDPKSSLDVEVIIKEAEAEIRSHSNWEDLELHWKRVAEAGRKLARRAHHSMGIEEIADALKGQYGLHVSSIQDSHYQQCSTIVAHKRG